MSGNPDKPEFITPILKATNINMKPYIGEVDRAERAEGHFRVEYQKQTSMVPGFFAWEQVGVSHLIVFLVVACCVLWMWRTRPNREPKEPVFAVILG